jgi:D-glycero-D-manno-heptose 1,7-bisphosphate phosphatase
MRKALFLDRDGVINIDKNYVYKISDFEFIDGIFEICRKYQEQDFLIFVVTNQAGIARKIYTDSDFRILTEWMLGRFIFEGIVITKVYYCPHHPEFTGPCACRKPNPGLFLRAADEFGLDLNASVLIGDKESDMQAGRNAGIGRCMNIQNVLSLK